MYQKSSKLVVQNLSPQNCSSSHWVLNKNEMLGTKSCGLQRKLSLPEHSFITIQNLHHQTSPEKKGVGNSPN